MYRFSARGKAFFLLSTVRGTVLLSALWFSPDRGYAESKGDRVLHALEQHVRARISNPENPKAAEIKIVPYDSEASTAKGRFKTIIVRSSPAKIKHVPIEEINLRADDVTIDVDQLLKKDDLDTKKSGKTTVEGTVSADNLNALFAGGKATHDMNLKARFEDGKVKISGYWKLFMFKGPIQTVGRLILTKKNTLDFEMDSLKINNREAPKSVKDQFMERLNPVVQFDDIPFRPKITTLTFKGDKVFVST
ncbi:MAG: DUF2993 domain-containing protein [Armatimonadetes bacterium]|nr:DUF2993 domain-containing protein [Armatimonadota bacterium]